jgi:hypothetical protein
MTEMESEESFSTRIKKEAGEKESPNFSSRLSDRVVNLRERRINL